MIINVETCDPSTGYNLCVYPRESRRKRSSWIMWISPDGSADLYAERDESGAIQGDPIHLAASVARATLKETGDEDDDDDEVDEQALAAMIEECKACWHPRHSHGPSGSGDCRHYGCDCTLFTSE